MSSLQRVAIIGQGNVSIDCVRILVRDRDELARTDISASALDVLRKVPLTSVDIVGRRGHVQAAFTIKELREMGRLATARTLVYPSELELGDTPQSREEVEGSRAKARIVELIRSYASSSSSSSSSSALVDVSLRFLLQPVGILTRPHESGGSSGRRVSGVTFERTALTGAALAQKAMGTGVFETIPVDLVITSLGYRNSPIEHVPFCAASNRVPHHESRVMHPENSTVKGLYVTGWLKRGPRGAVEYSIVFPLNLIKC